MIPVNCENQMKHISTLCEQSAEFSLMLKHMVYIVTTMLPKVTEGGKGKLSLWLISWALFQEGICGSGIIPPSLLTSALDGGESSASSLCSFTPVGEAGWAPESILTLWRRVKFYPYRKSNQGCPALSPSVYRLRYPDSYRRRENNNKAEE
jgi:hypothetical protein